MLGEKALKSDPRREEPLHTEEEKDILSEKRGGENFGLGKNVKKKKPDVKNAAYKGEGLEKKKGAPSRRK